MDFSFLEMLSGSPVDIKGVIIPGVFLMLVLIAGYYLLTNHEIKQDKSLYKNYTALFYIFIIFFAIVFGTLMTDLSGHYMFRIWEKPNPVMYFKKNKQVEKTQFFKDNFQIKQTEEKTKNDKNIFDGCKEELFRKYGSSPYKKRMIEMEARINLHLGLIIPLFIATIICLFYLYKINKQQRLKPYNISRKSKQIISVITLILFVSLFISNINKFRIAVSETEPGIIYNAYYDYYKDSVSGYEYLQHKKFKNNRLINDFTEYVDPSIGTKGGGNTFIGTSLPFAMVKLGPDSWNKSYNSGYQTDSVICGFSHVHVSGTGGGPKYGNILIMPQFGSYQKDSFYMESERENAQVGYYRVTLNKYENRISNKGKKEKIFINAITAELTSTHNTGFHKYKFPENENPEIIFDVSSFLGKGHCCGEEQELIEAKINVSDTVISGYSKVKGGWNVGAPYTVYFNAIFSKKFDAFELREDNEHKEKTTQLVGKNDLLGIFKFNKSDTNEIQIKVGISFLSEKKAKENREEIYHWNFNKIRTNARNEWNEILEKIEIQTDKLELKQNFYTGIYHSCLMPTNRFGEHKRIKEQYYDDYYAIWDTYRTTDPLRILITPEIQTDILKSLLNIYKKEGYAPDARSGNSNGRTQGGSNSDILFTEAYLKGLRGIDYDLGLKSMLNNAKNEAKNTRNEGRAAIKDYKKLKYIPSDIERAGTRTMEYCLCDWAIAILADSLSKQKNTEVADSLYKQDIADEFYKRANYWKNLWRNDTIVDGIKGFIWPKDKDKKWCYNDTILRRNGTWHNFLYEGTTWEYSLFVPHDVKALINEIGEENIFIKRLDHLFDNNYFNVKNEPSFLTPMLYIWAGDHSSTAKRVNDILTKYYTATPDGLPGNDDAGAMSAWYVFNAMGIYPNAGSDIYLITSPIIEKSTINLYNGEKFEIETKYLTDENIYVQAAYLNGEMIDRAWLKHQEIISGGKLVLIMGARKDKWKLKTPPPSLSDWFLEN